MKPLVALSLLFLPAVGHARVDPQSFQDFAFRQHPGAQLPLATPLIDAQGRPFTLAAALDGRPAILVLEYLRCRNLCSLVLSGAAEAMVKAGVVPGRDANLVALSIDPRDTPADAGAAAAMYARRFPDPTAAATGVRFFTASPDVVRGFAAAIGFPYRFDRPSGQFLHPAGFVVLTPAGKISRYMLGLSPNAAQLKEAVAKAARDQVQPPAHPLLCLCFGYDPEEGSVAALTWKLVQRASLAVVLACALLVGFLSLRRRTV